MHTDTNTSIINTKAVAREGYSYYSVSRLQTYLKCGEAYRLQYVEKVRREYTCSYSTVVGSLVHGVLEQYLLGGGPSLVALFDGSMRDTLLKLGLMDGGSDSMHSDLLRYSKGISSLYERASAGYAGGDAIRTAKGDVPSMPQATTAWKDAAVGLGHGMLKGGLDAMAVGRGLSFSLCDACAEAYALINSYQVPAMDALHVELGLSKYREDGVVINPVPLPEEYGGDRGIYLSGSIDLVAMVEGKLTVVDHKTSSGPAPTVEEVSTNPQLLAYAWAYEQLTGQVVEAVAINHIRSGRMVLAPVSIHRDKVLQSLLGAHKAIEVHYFPMHTPSEYDSPCNKWYGKECPFRGMCWG